MVRELVESTMFKFREVQWVVASLAAAAVPVSAATITPSSPKITSSSPGALISNIGQGAATLFDKATSAARNSYLLFTSPSSKPQLFQFFSSCNFWYIG
jgi:hypothetical protein